jgi:hypothetical protein
VPSHSCGKASDMALSNPMDNIPVLTSTSARHSLHSRSPSRSPVRYHARDFDPLLRDLSPTTTLRAFSAEVPRKSDRGHRALPNSFDDATASERALGAKAARAGLDFRSWVRELESWEWPGTFDVPEPARKKMRMSVGTMTSLGTMARASEDGEDEYWGSLSRRTVEDYERRTDDIARELEHVDVEEMKSFVLSAHRRAGAGDVSVDDSIGAIGSATDLHRLDDFTALITATILQALPYLSRLNRLLDLWNVRLVVLRHAPTYLHDLKQARIDLDHGWAAIALAPPSPRGDHTASFTRDTMNEMRGTLERQVASLGRRLDRFLDDLEGRADTVPEAWIEDFEDLEAAYGEWVVQAERRVWENEWRITHADRLEDEQQKVAHRAEAEQLLTSGHTSNGELERKISDSYASEDHTRDRDSLIVPSSRPTSGLLDLPTEALQQGTAHTNKSDISETTKGITGDGVPPLDEMVHATSIPGFAPLSPELESPTKRPKSRHTPIIINYDAPDEIQQLPHSPDEITTFSPPLTATAFTDEKSLQPNNVAKKRAAFAKAEIEKVESLQRQSKSPVRPFEHASNAFTRLFRKDKDKTPSPVAEQSRSNSLRSTLSTRSSASKKDALKKTVSPPAAAAPERPPSNHRTSVARARSSSQRSSVARSQSYNGAVIGSVPIGLPRAERSLSSRSGQRPQRDYVDLPGGFRPRSRSAEDSPPQPSRPRSQRREEDESRERRLERLPSSGRGRVETYQPTRLSGARLESPFRPASKESEKGQDYPADWPLVSPPDTEANSPAKEVPPILANASDEMTGLADEDEESSPEITSPRFPMESSDFDRIFVRSMPGTPQPEAGREFAGNPLESVIRRHSVLKSDGSVPTPEDLFSLTQGTRGVSTVYAQTTAAQDSTEDDLYDLTQRIPGLDADGERTTHLSPPSGGSLSSDVSPEKGQETARTDYFYAHHSSRPITSPTSSSRAARDQHKVRSPTAAALPKLHIPAGSTQLQADSGAEADVEAAEAVKQPSLVHRASVASIESHPRSALRSIEMPRRFSHGPGLSRSVPQTPNEPVSALEASSMPATPLSYKGMVVFPSPPNHGRTRSPVSPVGGSPSEVRYSSFPFSARTGVEEKASPIKEEQSTDTSSTPLNAAMSKRQTKATKATNSVGSPKAAPPLKPGEDTFDRHVSEVLDRLPSHAIKFRPRPGAETPVSARTADPRGYAGPPRPKAPSRLSSRTSTGGAGLTLAPADLSPKKSAEEVKLYHLTQAGRDEPIKLFVRLVGDGERVMVRVGGGWADLAEYLRQYAEHHGSRTVSGKGGVELVTVDSAASRKVSTSSTGGVEPKARRVSIGTPTTPRFARDTTDEHLGDDVPDDDVGNGAQMTASPIALPPHHASTPTNSIDTPNRGTPKSPSTGGERSRPSTASSAGSRPASRRAWIEAGMAGPGLANGSGSKRNNENKRGTSDVLPQQEQKARWVEGMLEKATKAASAEKEKGKERAGKVWGDLGKVGGTRRVVFRQSSSTKATEGGGA